MTEQLLSGKSILFLFSPFSCRAVLNQNNINNYSRRERQRERVRDRDTRRFQHPLSLSLSRSKLEKILISHIKNPKAYIEERSG